jgi:hypothetical protein
MTGSAHDRDDTRYGRSLGLPSAESAVCPADPYRSNGCDHSWTPARERQDRRPVPASSTRGRFRTITAWCNLRTCSHNCTQDEPITVSLISAVVTSCTQRKCGDVRVDFRHLPDARGLKTLAKAWQRQVAAAPPAKTVATLYRGRSIADTVAVAACLSTRWYVVSAGLGLICEDQTVPSYECTVAPGSSLSVRLARLRATAGDWWSVLTAQHPRPLSRLIAQGPTLLALPSSYLRMVLQDLSHVSTSEADHLRIFTSTAGAAVVPDHLAGCVMPYDDRLESVPGYSGTRSDFAQRALRHFVQDLGGANLSRDAAKGKVSAALARRPHPSRSQGIRLSDDEIRQVLVTQWTRHEGRSTRLLRYLRDEAGISCEQKRFSRIWQSLAIEMQVRS